MTIRAFWWAPSKSARVFKVEMQGSGVAWARLLASSGRTLHNFGDDLTPVLLESILGERVRWAPPGRADIVAVGSILELYAERGQGAVVWGTGAREGAGVGEGKALRERLGKVAAVRGPLTRDLLGLGEGTVLGDPGILWAGSLGLDAGPSPSGPSLLPHYRVWQSEANRDVIAAYVRQGYRVIEPTLSPALVAERIATSEYLITSSLHGVIVAHSLGVPVILTTFDANFSGERPFKYLDYFGSLGLEPSWVQVKDLLNPQDLEASLTFATTSAPTIRSQCESLGQPLAEALRKSLG